jgi:hypothetical protein
MRGTVAIARHMPRIAIAFTFFPETRHDSSHWNR